MKKHKLKNYKFLGVFSRDEIPELHKLECCIFNNKNRNEEGEHWLCLYKAPSGVRYVFDSFGRDKSMFGFSNNIRNAYRFTYKEILEQNKNDTPVEQKISEENCGYRCIVFLRELDSARLLN